jgi:hypothetical protein
MVSILSGNWRSCSNALREYRVRWRCWISLTYSVRDTVVLDDFKTALDRLKQHNMQRIGGFVDDGNTADFVDREQAEQTKDVTSPKQEHYEDAQGQNSATRTDKNYEELDFITAVRIEDLESGNSSSKR